MKDSGRAIIVSPLNWGLGHASRCIPLVHSLNEEGFKVILAGDGESLDLLRSEFPGLKSYELPSYDIRYSNHPAWFQLKLLSQGGKVLRTMTRERDLIERIVERENVSGIISDNRFGARSGKVPSVYLTHQLRVRAGRLSSMATRWHGRLISKFDQCWVCDHPFPDGLAGDLSSEAGKLNRVKWIGPLSRFSPGRDPEKDVDISIILSGPEPSRSIFEKKVRDELMGTEYSVVLVRGVIESSPKSHREQNFKVFDFLLSKELQALVRRSRVVVSRSGYSSIMDLSALGARALFVPTPGQAEQEYLGSYHKRKGLCHVVDQKSFDGNSIRTALTYPGFGTKKTSKSEFDKTLFDVFRQ